MNNINVEQNEASNHSYSVLTNASAGTGKTKILIDRLLKLIVSMSDPQKILCLTFTNAAANEIEKRINKIISLWLNLNFFSLQEEIKNFLQIEEFFNSKCILTIRKYLLNFLTNFKVFTIHSFCQKILQNFPQEIGIGYDFAVIDEFKLKFLLKKAKKELLHSDNRRYIDNFFNLTKLYGENQIDEFIYSAIKDSYKMDSLLKNVEEYRKHLVRYLDLLNLKLPNLQRFAKDEINNIFEFFEKVLVSYINDISNFQLINVTCKLESDQKKVEQINSYLKLDKKSKKINWCNLENIFIKKDKKKREKLFSSSFQKDNFFLLELIYKWQDAFYVLFNLYRKCELFSANYSFFLIIKDIYSYLNKIKKELKCLTYDDLIILTRKLLSDSGKKKWIFHQLGMIIEHVLVDEAQDTSSIQWDIIKYILEDYLKEKNHSSTIFVVGDPKQSIYSFQGADIKKFLDVQNYIKKKVFLSGNQIKIVNLLKCYRSSNIIIDFVHDVIKVVQSVSSNYFELENIKLISSRDDYGSIVELYDLIDKEELTSQKENIVPNFELDEERTLNDITAEAIALKVKELLEKKILLPSTKKIISPNDIMILIQKKGLLSDAIISIFEKKNIPIVNNKKTLLQNNLTVWDITAVAKFVLFPKDDLNLAVLLKSPFFSVEENFLYKISRENKTSWFEYICEMENDLAKELKDELLKMLALYKTSDMFTFFYIILDYLRKREILLGQRGGDYVINEFLQVVQDFLDDNESNLQKFLDWFYNNSLAIKNDYFSQEGVKLMTVHAAKGLQSSVVIIADSNSFNFVDEKVYWDKNLLLFAHNDSSNKISKLKDNDEFSCYQEYIRLMYVAFTRSQDYLIIYGTSTKKQKFDTWYDFCSSVMIKSSYKLKSATLNKIGVKKTGVYIRFSKYFIQNSTLEINDKFKNLVDKQKNIEDVICEYCFYFNKFSSNIKSKFESKLQDQAFLIENKQNHYLIDDVVDDNKIENYNYITAKSSKNFQLDLFSKPFLKKNTIRQDILTNNENLLSEGRKIHKILERIVSRQNYEEVISGPLFSSISSNGKKKIKYFFESEIYSQIMGCKVQTEMTLVNKNMSAKNSSYTLLRPDLVCFSDNNIKVIDYKTDMIVPSNKSYVKKNYVDQVNQYTKVLSEIYKKNVFGYILWLANVELMQIV